MQHRSVAEISITEKPAIASRCISISRSWDQRYHPCPGFVHNVNLPETFVVKCKWDRDERNLAAQILLGMPIRVSKHSKYMTAVSAIL